MGPRTTARGPVRQGRSNQTNPVSRKHIQKQGWTGDPPAGDGAEPAETRGGTGGTGEWHGAEKGKPRGDGRKRGRETGKREGTRAEKCRQDAASEGGGRVLSERWGVVSIVLHIRCQGANPRRSTGWRRPQLSPQCTLRGAPGGDLTRKGPATRRRVFIYFPSGGRRRSVGRGGGAVLVRAGVGTGGVGPWRTARFGLDGTGMGAWRERTWCGWTRGCAWRCGGEEWCAASHGAGNMESHTGPAGPGNAHDARRLEYMASRSGIRRRGFSGVSTEARAACPTDESAR